MTDLNQLAESITLKQFVTQDYTEEQIYIYESYKTIKDDPFCSDKKMTRWLTNLFLNNNLEFDERIALVIKPIFTKERYSKLINLLEMPIFDFDMKHKTIIFHNLLPIFIEFDVSPDSINYRQESYLYKYLFLVLTNDVLTNSEPDGELWENNIESENLVTYFDIITKHWYKKMEYWDEFLLKAAIVKKPFRFNDIFNNKSLAPSKEIYLQMIDSYICEYFYRKCSRLVYDIASFIDLNYEKWKDTEKMELCISYLEITPELHIRMIWDMCFVNIVQNAIKYNNIRILKLVLKYYDCETKFLINKYYDPMHYAVYHNSIEMMDLVKNISDTEYYCKSKIFSYLIELELEQHMHIEQISIMDEYIYVKTNLFSYKASIQQTYDVQTKTFLIEKTQIQSPKADIKDINDIKDIQTAYIKIPVDAEIIKFIKN